MIKILRFVVVLLIICSKNAVAFNESSHEIPDELTFTFTGKSFKTYINLLNKIQNTPGDTIFDQYKKKFKLNGFFYNLRGEKIFISGRARITGDLKDHTNFKKSLASLSISLKKTNIGGVTKFRLLLPETRGHQYEIFWSSLMEEIGFPVPIRKYVNVNIMGKKQIFIFEEKPEKEFLESVGIREAPIIEYDERQMYANRKAWEKSGRKIKIGIWHPHKELLNEQYKLKNSDFFKNSISEMITLKSISAVPPKSKPIEIFDKLNNRYAKHGLHNHNRKFIYDPIYNDYMPIYFDGNISANYMKKDCSDFNIDSYSDNTKKKIKKLDAKFFDRTIKTKRLSKDMKCVAANLFKISNHLDLNPSEIKPIKDNILDQKSDIKNVLAGIDENGYPDILQVKPEDKIIQRLKYDNLRKIWTQSDNINYTELKKILLGNDKPKLIKNYEVFDVINFDYPTNYLEKYDKFNLQNKSIEINVLPNETAYIKLTAFNSKVNVVLHNENSKIVFYKSKINKSKVFINSKENKKKVEDNPIRYDSRLLTSCGTFIDSSMEDSFFSSQNCKLEDGINFIRSNGLRVAIKVTNSSFDALDADFSTLNFDEVSINKAGNDCIDVSSGVYNFRSIDARYCGDKAVSIGEKSLVAINNAKINEAKIGIALKDSSEASLKALEKSNLDRCIDVYQKKQEFGPGKIKIDQNINCEVSLKHGSELKNTDVCIKVGRNYYFDTCQQKNIIKFIIKKPLPEKSLFYLNTYNKKTNKIENNSSEIQQTYSDVCKIDKRCEFEVKLNGHDVSYGLYDKENGKYKI